MQDRLVPGRKWPWVLATLILFVGLTLADKTAAQEVIDRIVAMVNGKIITLSDVDKRLKPLFENLVMQQVSPTQYTQMVDRYRCQILETMINDIVINEEAERLKVTVTDMELENSIRDMKERKSLTEEMFQNQLALEKMTRKEYVAKVRQQLLKGRLVSYMVHKKVVVTEDEAHRYFEANVQEGSVDRKRKLHLELIVLPLSQNSTEVVRLIETKKLSFAEAAKKYSVGPAADKGGDVGTLALEDLGFELQQALNGLKVGELSKPFKLEGRDAFLRVADVEGAVGNSLGGMRNFESSKQEIMQELYEVKLEERAKEYVEKLRKKAVIKINLN